MFITQGAEERKLSRGRAATKASVAELTVTLTEDVSIPGQIQNVATAAGDLRDVAYIVLNLLLLAQ
jgi:hypothetical protein